MQPHGVKRKLYVAEDVPASSEIDVYSHFRQSLLDLSLDKFYQGRLLVEPSLRRYVLITNTLRVIQEDIRRASNPSSPLGLQLVCPSLPAVLPAQAATLTPENHFTTAPDELDNMLFSSEEDFSLSASISNILRELDVVLDGGSSPSTSANSLHQAENQEMEAKLQLALDTCVSQKPFPGSSDNQELQNMPLKAISFQTGFSQNALGDPTSIVESKDIELINQLLINVNGSQGFKGATESEEPQQAPEREMPVTPLLGSFEVMSSRYLRDLTMDDLFLDIDTSVFERDPSLLGTAASGWPLSCTVDGPQAFPASCNWMMFASSQSGRDLNELENIMEVFVGS